MKDTVQRSSILTWLLDPFRPTTEATRSEYRFTGDARSWLAPIGIGVALLVISLVGWVVDAHQFYFSYYTGWVFCLSLSLGALFFLFFQHLTRAQWSVVVRRLSEALAWGFPLLLILGIPILFGMHDLFHWTHEELYDPSSPKYDEILAGKRAYLNTPFWLGRVLFYFAAWSYLAYKLYQLSVQQDVDPDPEIPSRMRTISAWGLPLTGVTTAFASYDLLMSLDPHWFSTIFGVYFFAGAMLGVHSLLAVTAIVLRRGNMLDQAITREHYQDLGKYMFGFVVFWAYIAFSQYMLIWYSGIPEETVFYRHRMEHGWAAFSAALLLGHFVIPFLLLLPRFVKRALPFMAVMGIALLVMHWFDYLWISAPVLHEHATFHWLDFTSWLGLTSLFIGTFVYRLSRHGLLPQNDPYLAKSMRFENS
jgi:hypothetical protein